jgi:Trk-type K+ transport system membrane component
LNICTQEIIPDYTVMLKVSQAGFQACNSSTDHAQPEKFLMLQMNVGLHSCSTSIQLRYIYIYIYIKSNFITSTTQIHRQYTREKGQQDQEQGKRESTSNQLFDYKAKKGDDNVDLI